jgi:8-oxo-dGTP pyrophosphatase MutT (NUDIX family)
MGCDTSTAVSRALKEVIEACQQKDLFSMLRNRDTEWRAIAGAKYPVRILRYAQPLFGIVGQGVHLTAYVQCPDGLKIWVARRSSTIDAFPGMLDNTAAGSVPADLTPLEAMIEEAREEASLSPQLIRRNIRASGALSYVTLTEASHGEEQGLIIPDVIYVYDLELEEDALPKPHDNEVQQFYLMDTDEIKTRLTNGEFKPNCAIVMIDFFVRNGIITAENERDYVEICMHLHRSLPFGTATY